MKAMLEIRAGEGGNDAKLFIYDMLKMYQKYCAKHDIKSELLDASDSDIVISLNGNIQNLIKFETGVHRIQRVPPTESKGRRHSSTVTVAVLPVSEKKCSLNPNEIRIETMRGRGPGGQHRNTSDTAVKAIHEPTGVIATCTKGRSQHRNKQDALSLLAARVKDMEEISAICNEQDKRQKQIGKAGRCEKIRTYNFVENRIKDVRLKKALYCLDKVMDGNLDAIYCATK